MIWSWFEQIALKKRAIHLKKTYFVDSFYYTIIPPFYAKKWIAPVALRPVTHDKRATGAICSFSRAYHTFALWLTKNERFAWKTNERIPNLVATLLKLFIFVRYCCKSNFLNLIIAYKKNIQGQYINSLSTKTPRCRQSGINVKLVSITTQRFTQRCHWHRRVRLTHSESETIIFPEPFDSPVSIQCWAYLRVVMDKYIREIETIFEDTVLVRIIKKKDKRQQSRYAVPLTLI